MSKQSSVRISFTSLKNEQNKQNQLTFQNLKTQSPTNSCGGYHKRNFPNNYNHQRSYNENNEKYTNNLLNISNYAKYEQNSFNQIFSNFAPYTQYRPENVIKNQSNHVYTVHTKNGQLGLQCSTSSSKFAQTIRKKQLQKSRKRQKIIQNKPVMSSHSSVISQSSQSPNASANINNKNIRGNFNYGQTNNAMSNSPKYFNSRKNQEYKNLHQQLLQQSYTQAQKSIRLQIQQYNSKYAEVTEILADLHIKDLMKFNQMLQKNQDIYLNYRENSLQFENSIQIQQNQGSFGNISGINFYQLSFQDSKKIYEVERALMRIISQRTKSYQFMSTNQSRNKKRASTESQNVFPHRSKDQNFQFKITKKNSQKLTDSFTQQLQCTNFLQSNNSKLSDNCERINKEKQAKQKQRHKLSYLSERQIKAKDKNRQEQKEYTQDNVDLQDTPESVKSKISFSSKIQTEKNVIIGMFDRINVCESIEENLNIENSQKISPNQINQSRLKQLKGNQNEKMNSIIRKRRDSQYRYGRSSQQ